MIRRLFLALIVLTACAKPEPEVAAPRPSILLITLDTTRADAIGPDTPAIVRLADRGRTFQYAYATCPQTLPSHSSMMTGLYPAGHGVHENARFLGSSQAVLAEKLHGAGYRTAAFVSAFALARRFGLARGFDVYDEDFGETHAERTAQQTTERALAYLEKPSPQPLFLWVHYYDPHYPYTPPEPYRARYATNPYRGEVASMDERVGRLVDAFERSANGPAAIVIVSDHGEGLGEHGEQQHGNLLYQATMHVPLVLVGPRVTRGTSATPVSTRRVFHTILDWAGLGTTNSLLASDDEVVLAEAMRPFLDYGWQPQVMAVDGQLKTILAGSTEVYDVVADPGETKNLAPTASVSRGARAALRDYPIASADAAQPTGAMTDEERRKLASLGYVSADVRPVVRKDAPRPADMTALFPVLDRASGFFVREQYRESIALFEQVLAQDPHNLDAALRLATAHSSLGNVAAADEAFEKARRIAPNSPDVQTYLALHQARGKDWEKAVPALEQLVAASPERVPPLEALAVVREKQKRYEESLALRQKIYSLRTPSAEELLGMAGLAMQLGRTDVAIDALEKARVMQDKAFRHNLELGVLYLAARRLENARDALDRVPPAHPAYPMALFKRAQVSVLLREADAPARIAAARKNANAVTRELIARERLFQ